MAHMDSPGSAISPDGSTDAVVVGSPLSLNLSTAQQTQTTDANGGVGGNTREKGGFACKQSPRSDEDPTVPELDDDPVDAAADPLFALYAEEFKKGILTASTRGDWECLQRLVRKNEEHQQEEQSEGHVRGEPYATLLPASIAQTNALHVCILHGHAKCVDVLTKACLRLPKATVPAIKAAMNKRVSIPVKPSTVAIFGGETQSTLADKGSCGAVQPIPGVVGATGVAAMLPPRQRRHSVGGSGGGCGDDAAFGGLQNESNDEDAELEFAASFDRCAYTEAAWGHFDPRGGQRGRHQTDDSRYVDDCRWEDTDRLQDAVRAGVSVANGRFERQRPPTPPPPPPNALHSCGVDLPFRIVTSTQKSHRPKRNYSKDSLRDGPPIATPRTPRLTPLLLAASWGPFVVPKVHSPHCAEFASDEEKVEVQTAMCRSLLRCFADATQVDAYGRTALHWACVHGNARLVCDLLQCGVSPLAEDYRGNTPLRLACAMLRTEISAHAVLGADIYRGRQGDYEHCIKEIVETCPVNVLERPVTLVPLRSAQREDEGTVPIRRQAHSGGSGGGSGGGSIGGRRREKGAFENVVVTYIDGQRHVRVERPSVFELVMSSRNWETPLLALRCGASDSKRGDDSNNNSSSTLSAECCPLETALLHNAPMSVLDALAPHARNPTGALLVLLGVPSSLICCAPATSTAPATFTTTVQNFAVHKPPSSPPFSFQFTAAEDGTCIDRSRGIREWSDDMLRANLFFCDVLRLLVVDLGVDMQRVPLDPTYWDAMAGESPAPPELMQRLQVHVKTQGQEQGNGEGEGEKDGDDGASDGNGLGGKKSEGAGDGTGPGEGVQVSRNSPGTASAPVWYIPVLHILCAYQETDILCVNYACQLLRDCSLSGPEADLEGSSCGTISCPASLLDARVGTNGWTPLHRAAFVGNNDAVIALCNWGASLHAKTTESDETPIDIARRRGHDIVEDELASRMRHLFCHTPDSEFVVSGTGGMSDDEERCGSSEEEGSDDLEGDDDKENVDPCSAGGAFDTAADPDYDEER